MPAARQRCRRRARRLRSCRGLGLGPRTQIHGSGNSSAVSSPQRRRHDGSSGAHGSTTSARSTQIHGSGNSSAVSSPQRRRHDGSSGAHGSTTSARSNERRRASTPLAGKAGNLRRRLGVSSDAHGGAQSKNEAHSAIVKMHQIGPLCNSQTSSQCQVADKPVERHRFHQ